MQYKEILRGWIKIKSINENNWKVWVDGCRRQKIKVGILVKPDSALELSWLDWECRPELVGWEETVFLGKEWQTGNN